MTTSRSERAADRSLAALLAASLGTAQLPRRGRTVTRLLADEALAGLIVVADGGVTWHQAGGGTFFFHPNMAVARLRPQAGGGWRDPLVQALELRPGDRLLDATCGLGADAVVLSHLVGPRGVVVALEASPVIAALVRCGLATWSQRLRQAMRRIILVSGDHRELLAPDSPLGGGWDGIVFDPMFDRPLRGSHGLDGVRRLACYDQLEADTIIKARALARRCVVVKGRRGDPWFEGLAPDKVVQPRRSQVGFAVFAGHAGSWE